MIVWIKLLCMHVVKGEMIKVMMLGITRLPSIRRKLQIVLLTLTFVYGRFSLSSKTVLGLSPGSPTLPVVLPSTQR